MKQYKIRVSNVSEAIQASHLFLKLGYKPDNSRNGNYVHWVVVFKDGTRTYLSTDENLAEFDEITLPHLEELVVLHRNDVNDATHEMPNGEKFLKLSDGWRYWTDDGLDKNGEYSFAWQLNGNSDDYLEKHLKPIKQCKAVDAELVERSKKFITSDHLNRFQAAQAHLEGRAVQFMTANGDFIDITDNSTVGIFAADGGYSFRIKPRTIVINGIEVPAPFKPKNDDQYWFIDANDKEGYNTSIYRDDDELFYLQNNVFGFWRTEEDIKQVIAVLRKVLEVQS